MAREDFGLLSDDEIRDAISVAAAKLATKHAPAARAALGPKFSMIELEDFWTKKLAERHGLTDLFRKDTDESGVRP